MRCRSLVTLVGEKNKTRQKTTKKKALERENGSSGCKVHLGDGTWAKDSRTVCSPVKAARKCCEITSFIRSPLLVLQFNTRHQRRKKWLLVQFCDVLLKCYDTPESDYYFTTVHWCVGVNCVFDLVSCQLETVGIGLIAFSASRYFIKKKCHYREMSAMLAFVLGGFGTHFSTAQNKWVD